MNTADKITEYTAAAVKTGLPVESVTVEKNRVVVKFARQADIEQGEGLSKDWTPK